MVAEALASTRVDVLEAMLHVRSPKRSTRYRYTRNAIIAGGAVILLTGGALAVALAPPEVIAVSASCYSEPSLDSFVQVNSWVDTPFDPIAACGLEYNVPDSELSVCTLPNGTAGVFPREGRPAEDFCAALGLADWGSD